MYKQRREREKDVPSPKRGQEDNSNIVGRKKRNKKEILRRKRVWKSKKTMVKTLGRELREFERFVRKFVKR